MIKYCQFENKYLKQINDMIFKIMVEELKIERKIVSTITMDLKDIETCYIKNGGNFWVAIDDKSNEVVGTVGILKKQDNNAEFKRFYVKENYRNQHIGSVLYKLAEEFVQENSIKNLYLVSGSNSKKAIGFYCKNGWKNVDLEKEHIDVYVREGARLYKKIIRTS